MTINEGIFNRNRVREKPYSAKYIAGLVGEKEARRWLTEQGYKYYLFEFFDYKFYALDSLNKTFSRRRKPEYQEKDKTEIANLEAELRGLLGKHYETMKRFFSEFFPMKAEIKRSRWERMRAEHRYIAVGGITPDFFVWKDNEFSIVEVKANKSMPTKHQRACFELGKKYGYKSMVLRIMVDVKNVKEVKLQIIEQTSDGKS